MIIIAQQVIKELLKSRKVELLKSDKNGNDILLKNNPNHQKWMED
jgi:hypothetical protein